MSDFTRLPAFNIPMTISLVSFVAACLLLTGCVTDERALDTSRYYNRAYNLESAARDNGVVAIRWGVAYTGTTDYSDNDIPEAYRLTWSPVHGGIESSADTGTMILRPERYASTLTAVVPGLGAKLYRFVVKTLYTAEEASYDSSTCFAAPTVFHRTDAARPGEEIRIYEPASEFGSGLVLSPEHGGPRRVTVSTSAPQIAEIELIVDGPLVPPGNMFLSSLGRYSSIEGQEHLGNENASLHIIGYNLQHPELNDWFTSPYSASDDDGESEWDDIHHLSNSEIVLPMTTFPDQTWGYGIAVSLRHTYSSPQRFARVHIMHENGAVLRGEAPNRYVVLTVSMGHPGVPYA